MTTSAPSGPWPGGVPSFDLTPLQRTFTLVGAALGVLLVAVDQTAGAIAGPVIQRELALPVALYPCMTIGYLLAATVTAPLFDRLSDGHGRKPILLLGFTLYLTGSLLSGFAGAAAALISGRAVQGAGAAALLTGAFAIAAEMPGKMASKMPGSTGGRLPRQFASAWGAGAGCGFVLGGLLTERFGWRSVFFANLPLGTVAVLVIFAKMPWLRPPRRVRRRIHLLGAAVFSSTALALAAALCCGRTETAGPFPTGLYPSGGGGFRWSFLSIALLVGGTAVGVLASILVERRVRDPLFDLRWLRNRGAAWASALVFVVGYATVAGVIFVPLHAVAVAGASPARAGAAMTALPLGLIAGIIAAKLAESWGHPRALLLASLILPTAAFATLASSSGSAASRINIAELTWASAGIGSGVGVVLSLTNAVVRGVAAPEELRAIKESVAFIGTCGAMVALATLGAVFTNQLAIRLTGVNGSHAATETLAFRNAYGAALARVWWLPLCATTAAALLVWFMPTPSSGHRK